MTRRSSRFTALIVAVITLISLGFGAAGAASAAPSNTVSTAGTTVPVTGTLANGAGAVNGTLDVTKFVKQNGQLMAIGTFTGTVTDAAGNVTSGSQQLTLPVNTAQSSGSCQILDLVLGPLDLDLLGLQVHLDTVHLNITAQQGSGNLLGNLLCAVANLLNGPSPAGGLAGLLNRILGAL
jgi:hypothetical protein